MNSVCDIRQSITFWLPCNKRCHLLLNTKLCLIDCKRRSPRFKPSQDIRLYLQPFNLCRFFHIYSDVFNRIVKYGNRRRRLKNSIRSRNRFTSTETVTEIYQQKKQNQNLLIFSHFESPLPLKPAFPNPYRQRIA